MKEVNKLTLFLAKNYAIIKLLLIFNILICICLNIKLGFILMNLCHTDQFSANIFIWVFYFASTLTCGAASFDIAKDVYYVLTIRPTFGDQYFNEIWKEKIIGMFILPWFLCTLPISIIFICLISLFSIGFIIYVIIETIKVIVKSLYYSVSEWFNSKPDVPIFKDISKR